MALPVLMRFRDPRAIRLLLRRGRRLRTPLGEAAYSEEQRGSGKILFIIPNRAAKKSTDRHRIKRRLDAWALKNRNQLSSLDIVLTVNAEAAKDTQGLLIRAEEAFQRIGRMSISPRAEFK